MQNDWILNDILTVWKLQNWSLIEKIFREINSLLISLVKTLLSRNFCQKWVKENFWNFHTVESILRLSILINSSRETSLANIEYIANFVKWAIMKSWWLTSKWSRQTEFLFEFTVQTFDRTMLQKPSKYEIKAARCGHFFHCFATQILSEIKVLWIQMVKKCNFWQF